MSFSNAKCCDIFKLRELLYLLLLFQIFILVNIWNMSNSCNISVNYVSLYILRNMLSQVLCANAFEPTLNIIWLCWCTWHLVMLKWFVSCVWIIVKSEIFFQEVNHITIFLFAMSFARFWFLCHLSFNEQILCLLLTFLDQCFHWIVHFILAIALWGIIVNFESFSRLHRLWWLIASILLFRISLSLSSRI